MKNFARIFALNLLIITLAFSCAAFGQVLPRSSSDPSPAGFRGITWGKHISETSDLKRIGLLNLYEGKDQMTAYSRDKDDLEIGYGKAEDITYLFWKDKFYGVFIKSVGNTNRNEFEKAITNWIGRSSSKKNTTSMESLEWNRERVRVVLEYRKTALAKKQDVSLYIISREMEASLMGF